jgi:hypothetical protein
MAGTQFGRRGGIVPRGMATGDGCAARRACQFHDAPSYLFIERIAYAVCYENNRVNPHYRGRHLSARKFGESSSAQDLAKEALSTKLELPSGLVRSHVHRQLPPSMKCT